MGVFRDLYSFIAKVEEYKEYISEVTIENTQNAVRGFHNIETNISSSKKYSKICQKVLYDTLTDEEQAYMKEANKAFDMMRLYKIHADCNSWVSAYDIAIAMRDAMQRYFSHFNINIKVEIHMPGWRSDNIYGKCMQFDFEDMLESEQMQKEIEKIKDKYSSWLLRLTRKQEELEKYIKSQKRAYVFSKLREGKLSGEDAQNYEGLIEAYDVYLDIKKSLSNKLYV